MTTDYVFGTEQDLAAEQHEFLNRLWDDHTARALDRISLPDQPRCLDIGAGSGSATRMLADRAGPRGSVLAVDIDDTHYIASSQATLTIHNIDHGLPEPGPFDVIHARLVLMHLPRRREILAELAAALAPGGWLVIADNGALPRLISAPHPEDAAIFDRFQELARKNAERLGLSFSWAEEIDQHMAASGLDSIHGVHLTSSGCGGSLEALLSHNYVLQMQDSLLRAGIPVGDVERYRDLWLEPDARFWFYDFACWAGRRPR